MNDDDRPSKMPPRADSSARRGEKARVHLAEQLHGSGLIATAVEREHRPGRRMRRMAVVANGSRTGAYTVAHDLARMIREAGDPTRQSSRVQTLATMSPEKRAEMERLYGKGPSK